MAFKQNSDGTLVEIDGKVRVEQGPLRRRAKATKELLSDQVTAAHYKVGAPDARNKPIVLGEPMDYIDWKSDARTWCVYALSTKPVTMTDGPKKGQTLTVPVWALDGSFEDRDAALSRALELAR